MIGTSTVPRPTLANQERQDISAAWGRYLSATRDCSSYRYEEVEPWAWNRLQTTLRRIEKRAASLRRPARIDEEDGA